MTVEINADDIRTGFPRSICNCPIGRALRRSGATVVRVHNKHCTFYYKGRYVYATLSDDAKRFSRAHGDGRPVKPTTITLIIEGASNAQS
ncbi:hypothetical protein EON81_09375 [bacterium]|nr:MAG: hypothetical protein EON81_09375 [bacterium]